MATLKIVTFNARNVWDKERKNSFIHRAGMIYDKINKERPDIVAFQELVPLQVTLLEKMFPEYSFYGQFRGENFDGEGLYVAFKKEKFQFLSYETFWISLSDHYPVFADIDIDKI